MSYLCAWEFFSSLASRKLLVWWMIERGHVTWEQGLRWEGVLKVVDKEEKVVVAKEVADRILGSSVLIIGSSSYLRYWRPLWKVTPTSISMGRADLKKIMKSSLISRELYISAADVRDLKLVWYVLRKIEPKFYQLAQLSWVLSYSETWNPICKRLTMIAGYDEKGWPKHSWTSCTYCFIDSSVMGTN